MNPLDEIVVRAALIDARKHLARGRTPSAAAGMACTGAWTPYRAAVESRLRAERQDRGRLYFDDNKAA